MRAIASLSAEATACALRLATRPKLTLAARLAALPKVGAPVREPVAVYWNDSQIPFIEASGDDDLAVALGVVHAHLRLAQMELMRRVAFARVAEFLGPAAIEIDRALRCLGLTGAVPEIVGSMPSPTRRWIEGFTAGINHVVEHAGALPPESPFLGLGRERWTVSDVVGVGRLASADMNWPMLFNALRLYGGPAWRGIWHHLVAGLELPDAEDAVDLATGFTEGGSNALAVAGRRSVGGAAIVGGDPHLDLLLPNFWLLGGFRSPSFHAVGLMIPGLPFIAMGRNGRIAWTGTSLHAASTDLYDVSALPEQAMVSQRALLKVRWSGEWAVDFRRAPQGPVISDVLEGMAPGATIALRWMGHRPSDEFTAMLSLNRARDWHEFLDAADGISVPGQTLLYGDVDGHIGRCLAVRLPRRPPEALPDLLMRPETADAWECTLSTKALPHSFDPPEGFLVSANLPPADAEVAVAHFHSPPYREKRLASLLSRERSISVADVARIQRDVHSQPALRLRDYLLERAGDAMTAGSPFATTLRSWNGGYDTDSAGAAAYERLLFRLLRALEGSGLQKRLSATWDPGGVARAHLAAMSRAEAAAVIRRAFAKAQRGWTAELRWGDVHRLRLPHFLGHLPLVGRMFRYGDLPWPGGNETLMKAAHKLSAGRHQVSYGADARIICDLSDPDGTYAVLVGGQDGWLGSSTAMDQTELWRNERYLRLPMRLSTIRQTFGHKTVLVARD